MENPGSGAPPKLFNIATACSDAGGVVTFDANKVISGTTLSVWLYDSDGAAVWSDSVPVSANGGHFTTSAQPDGDYVLSADNGENTAEEPVTIDCGVVVPPGGLRLAVSHTNEGNQEQGSITLTPSGGTDPVYLEVVELGLSLATTGGAPRLFTPVSAGTYAVRATDSGTPQQITTTSVTVLPYVAPATGCTDEYADSYDPEATQSDPAACSYTVRWRSAWGPAGMAVQVPALAGQTTAYTTAELFIGFRPGHPLAEARPLGEAITLRATVAPDGYATFRLAPYLWPALGQADGAGGYRLDLNSPTAFVEDVYVGYELRRPTGELLEHGYALNAAVPDAAFTDVYALSPFGNRALLWAGFEELRLPFLTVGSAFGIVRSLPLGELAEASGESSRFPCPVNPLPVAWLAPGGGYGYWVFSGRPQLADEVGEGQTFTEPASGQRRYAQRGEARGTITASTGVFNGPLFGEGLRTLWSSPQVWILQGEEWVAVTLGGGSFPVRRLGLPRTEITLTFTEATPHYAQGQ